MQVVIDVREPEEYARGHIEGALNIPPAELMSGTKKLNSYSKNDDEFILYCVSGARSNASMQILQQQGYKNLTNGVNKEHVAQKYNKTIV